MNKRQRNIIDILRDNNDWITGKRLSEMLNVSDRTVRTDILKINEEYHQLLIIASRRYSYRIDEKIFSRIGLVSEALIPQTSEERCKWILKELLLNDDINLINLEDKIFVSGFSIENDIQKIKRNISDFKTLSLKKSAKYLSLIDDEAEKRQLYKRLLNREIQGHFMNLNMIAELWTRFDILEVSRLFDMICEKYHYYVREDIYTMIMLHAGIAIERIMSHEFITHNCDEMFEDNQEYKVSECFFQKVSMNLKISFVETEVIWFASLLRGKGNTLSCQNKDEIEKIVYQMIRQINQVFEIDFFNDHDLINGLNTHIASLIIRQENHVKITNLYLKEIKKTIH